MATTSTSLLDLEHFLPLALVKTRDKVCTTSRWQHSPAPDTTREEIRERWTNLLARGFEPAVTLRTSGLIGFESDGEDDLFNLTETLCRHEVTPWIMERREDDPFRQHVYAWMPRGIDVPKVSFRFEAGRLTAASNNYYRCSYAEGPYTVWLHNPDAPPMSTESYAGLLADAEAAAVETRTARREGAPLAEGSRRNETFRFAAFLSRWTDDYALACDLADLWQEQFCDPPIPRSWVETQVKGAWKIASDEGRLGCELVRYWPNRTQVFAFARAVAPWCGDDADLIAELAEVWAAS
jgi:hypothetical protein